LNLQTKIPLQEQPNHQIDYNSNVLLLGSCFSENIGKKFNYFKFKSLVNPFGILFQPLAIENLVTRAINEDYYTENELGYNNEHYYCFDAHSKLNASHPEVLLSNLNSALDDTLTQIQAASHIIITLGTSWAYRFIETDAYVANCHKVPQKKFLKELLSVEEITTSLEGVISLIKSINPKVTFIFTVSPVRHIKDGFVENTLSKAHLISAIHEVIEPRHQLFYFPAYEIMMDELRDYRFYDVDMIHPSTTAIDYIWTRFIEPWLSNEAKQTQESIEGIQKGLSHKPFHHNSEAHQAFLEHLKTKIKTLQTVFPHISF
jgi:hypothetical protein